jgi:hypothetical protein
MAGPMQFRAGAGCGVRLALRHVMRVRLFLTLVLLLGSAGVLRGRVGTPVVIAEAEGCPVRLESAQLEPGSATGLRIKYVVHNPQGKKAARLILAAATVDRNQQVTAVRLASVDDMLEARSRSEHFVTFRKLAPIEGERLVVGIQAVGWSSGSEWSGVVRLAAADIVSASR